MTVSPAPSIERISKEMDRRLDELTDCVRMLKRCEDAVASLGLTSASLPVKREALALVHDIRSLLIRIGEK